MITDQSIVAGADIEWEETIPDYPATEYDLIIFLKLASAPAVWPTTTKNGDAFVHSISNALLTSSGTYQFQYKFTNLTDEKISFPSAYTGVIPVGASLANSGDLRSDDQKVLDALIDARLKVANREYVNISINGKATTFKDLEKLENMISFYKRKIGLTKRPILINSFR